MKPSWDDAPEWAFFLACDRDGGWCWFEFEPHPLRFEWAEEDGRTKVCQLPDSKWKKSLEKRP